MTRARKGGIGCGSSGTDARSVYHGKFRPLQYANTSVKRLNLALLMAVSSLPFPTKLLAEAIHDRDEREHSRQSI
jgi:uncharacterized membrane protein